MAQHDTTVSETENQNRGAPSTNEEREAVESRVGLSYTLAQLKRDPTAWIGFLIIGTVTLVAIAVFIDQAILHYWFANHFWVNPEIDTSAPSLLPPPIVSEEGTFKHILGTDTRGRDVLVRVVYGSRIAVEVGFISTAIGLVGGVLVGAIAGYYGGWIDDVLMRAVETLYAIPFLVLVIAFMTAFGRDIRLRHDRRRYHLDPDVRPTDPLARRQRPRGGVHRGGAGGRRP